MNYFTIKIFLFQLTLFIAPFTLSQITLVNFRNTTQDERLSDIRIDESSGSILVLMQRGDEPDTLYSYSNYLDYEHVLYRLDYNYQVVDSIYFNELKGYKKWPLHILVAGQDSIIVFGNALDTLNCMQKANIIWLNGDLEITGDSIYDLPYNDFPVLSAMINHSGNIILSHGYPLNKGSQKYEKSFAYLSYLCEINRNGNIVKARFDTCDYCFSGRIWDAEVQDHYLSVNASVIKTYDYDFNQDTLIMINCELCLLNNSVFNYDQLIIGGEYDTPGPPPILDSDVVLYKYDSNLEMTDLLYFGVADTNDRYPAINFVTNNNILLVYTKNDNFPLTDTWLNITYASLDGETFWTSDFGGYGKYVTVKIIDIMNGKKLVSGSWYDFHKFPWPNKQEDIFLLEVDIDGFTSTNPTTILSDKNAIYPDPFSGEIYINIEDGVRYNLKISNSMGSIVFDKEMTNRIIDLEYLPKGIYFYLLQSENNKSEKGKLIKN